MPVCLQRADTSARSTTCPESIGRVSIPPRGQEYSGFTTTASLVCDPTGIWYVEKNEMLMISCSILHCCSMLVEQRLGLCFQTRFILLDSCRDHRLHLSINPFFNLSKR